MTLSENQCHPNLYHNVELGGLYHHAKLEKKWVWKHPRTNQCERVCFVFLKQNHISRFLFPDYWIDKKEWVWVSSDQSLNSIPTSIHINEKLCEIINSEVFAFLQSCDLELGSWSNRLVLNCSSLSSYQVYAKQTYKWLNAFQQRFLTLSIKQSYFPNFNKFHSKIVSRCSTRIASTISNFTLISWKAFMKMKSRGFVLCWPQWTG